MESCHYANFVITGGTRDCHDTGATSDDKVGIMTTLSFQWYGINIGHIYDHHGHQQRSNGMAHNELEPWIMSILVIAAVTFYHHYPIAIIIGHKPLPWWIPQYYMKWKPQAKLAVCSLCNHVTLYGLASPRLLHSLIDHIKTSHSFKHRYSNGRWVVLYALVSPQWSHAWFRGRVRTILLPATKLYPCVNKLGGSM